MLHFPTWKVVAIVLTCLAGLVGTAPNLISKERLATLPNWMPKAQIPLGLDLQGGVHLVLEMNVEELKKAWYDQLMDDTRKILREAKVASPSITQSGKQIIVKVPSTADADTVVPELRKMIQSISGIGFGGAGGADLDIRRDGTTIIIEPTEAGLNQRITTGMGTAVETIRRRVDDTGTTEPNIVRQGIDRIVVQAPGFKDAEELKKLVGTTAKLTFQFVHNDYSPRSPISDQERRQIQIPAGSLALCTRDRGGDEKKQCLKDEKGNPIFGPSDVYEIIERRVIVQGEDLVKANMGTDTRSGQPMVEFRFNQNGARKFGRATQENTGRRFAIVLDNAVISAPRINEPILGGSGQITGNFTSQSASELAILLRSGALPATLTIVEERTVGPSLGADSIKAGKIATYVAFAAVAAFMMIAYGLFGFFSVIALALKLGLIFAIMSWMRATLTLPGIAGIALTIGIAVDANVLIYERMREELRNGKSAIAAIEAGFSRAIATIIDSQLTTLISAIILFWLGSGPIRGFGITLTIGVITAIFSAVTVTRLMIAMWLRYQRNQRNEIVVPV
jgi:protein-export membrane protein SecD